MSLEDDGDRLTSAPNSTEQTKTARIAELNDRLRGRRAGGRVMMTPGASNPSAPWPWRRSWWS